MDNSSTDDEEVIGFCVECEEDIVETDEYLKVVEMWPGESIVLQRAHLQCLEVDECPNCEGEFTTRRPGNFLRNEGARFCPRCGEPLPDHSEPEVQARLVSDVAEVEVGFDAAEVLSDWPVENIQGLKNECTSVRDEDWGPGEISDLVALESSDPRVTLFFRWLTMYNRHVSHAEGFYCVVDASEAMKWLEKNRPEVAKALEEDNE